MSGWHNLAVNKSLAGHKSFASVFDFLGQWWERISHIGRGGKIRKGHNSSQPCITFPVVERFGCHDVSSPLQDFICMLVAVRHSYWCLDVRHGRSTSAYRFKNLKAECILILTPQCPHCNLLDKLKTNWRVGSTRMVFNPRRICRTCMHMLCKPRRKCQKYAVYASSPRAFTA